MLRVCVLFVSVCVLGVGSLSGRGFFCRDPDTGKLHSVNTTWPATSFCGNYNCKLKRKNITNTEYAPLRLINITNIKLIKDKIVSENITNKVITNKTIIIKEDLNKAPKINNNLKIGRDTDDIQSILPLDKKKVYKTEEIIIKVINESDRERPDRYLTDNEIKSISEILHTVKKSDLDAIVEIYNLAQDIYKEIDKTSSDQTIEESLITSKTAKKIKSDSTFIKNAKKLGHVSYWYEPVISKLRPDLIRTDILRNEILRNDVVPLAQALPNVVKQVSSAVKFPHKKASPPTKPTTPQPIIVASSHSRGQKSRSDSFFNGPLSIKDFGKLPYYYPISNFQRLSSYMHQTNQQKKTSKTVTNAKLPNTVFKPVTLKPPIYSAGKYQKEIKPSILLPYPFSYIHHYNWSYPPGTHNSQLQLDEFELVRKKDQQLANSKNERQASEIVQNYVPKPNNVVLMNPDLENFHGLEIRASRADDKMQILTKPQPANEDIRRPEWQTDPLPVDVLEDVRAHIQEKQKFMKPFPLRKKVKSDRLGNLLKIGEITRVKRAVSKEPTQKAEEEPLEPQLYEVYIEKTTCNSDYTVPGFFRYGNLSQPYPECCPQRITNR